MRDVVLSLHILQAHADICIDGKEIDEFSELNAVLEDDFLKWAGSFFALMDAYLGEEAYTLRVRGMEFHGRLLSAMRPEAGSCAGVVFEPVNPRFSVDERLAELLALAGRYPQNHPPVLDARLLCVCEDESLLQGALAGFTPAEKAQIALLPACAQSVPAGIAMVIIPAETTGCAYRRRQCVLQICKEDEAALMEYLTVMHVKLPYIASMMQAAQYFAKSKEDELLLEALEQGCAKVLIEPLPAQMQPGDSAPLHYTVIPGFVTDRAYRFVSDDESVMAIRDGKAVALGAGRGVIRLMDGQGECAGTLETMILQQNYARMIQVSVPFQALHPGQSARIKVFVYPQDAEDADRLSFDVSDPSVAMFHSASGEIAAFKTGVCELTIRGERTQASVSIRVEDALKGIEVSPSSENLRLGESVLLRCRALPENAHIRQTSWMSSSELISIEPEDNGMACRVTMRTAPMMESHAAVVCVCEGYRATANIQLRAAKDAKISGCFAPVMSILSCLFFFLGFYNFFWYISLALNLYGKMNDQTGKSRFTVGLVLNVIFGLLGLWVWTAIQ